MDFTKVRAVHTRALKRLVDLRSTKSFGEYEEVYELMLRDIQLIWNKTESTLNRHPRKSFLLRKYFHEHDHDVLLVYVRKARDCQEHTIAEVTRRNPGSVVFLTQDGKLVSRDPDELMRSGRVHIGSPVIAMAATSSRAVPLPITVQRERRVYNPPTTHLGRAIAPQLIEDWLILCLNYYDQMIKELEQNA